MPDTKCSAHCLILCLRALGGVCNYIPRFTDEETEAQVLMGCAGGDVVWKPICDARASIVQHRRGPHSLAARGKCGQAALSTTHIPVVHNLSQQYRKQW